MMMMKCERIAPLSARIDRVGEEASGMPEIARGEKGVATEIEVIAIEPNVVAHRQNVVALGPTAVANAPATWLGGSRPSRSRPMPSRSTKRKLIGDFRRRDPVRRCRNWLAWRCERVRGACDRVAWRRDSIFGARISSAGGPR
jgi:hypothetical protein